MTPPRRPPKPGTSLLERHPRVAATWDAEANGELRPEDVAAQSGVLVHWRCPAGHTWQEKVERRTALLQWKRGDRAACAQCSGILALVRLSCGHEQLAPPHHAESDRRMCDNCWEAEKARRDAETRARKEAYERDKDTIKDEARADAGQLTDQVWRDRDLDRIHPAFRPQARKLLVSAFTFSLIAERNFGRAQPQRVAQAIGACEAVACSSLTAPPGRPLVIFDEAWWPAPFTDDAPAPAPAEPETLETLRVAALRALTGAAAAAELDARAWPDQAADAKRRAPLTAAITEGLVAWAYEQHWRPFRELRVPTPDARERGRLDLVCFRAGLPDLVLELDSSSSARSDAKLELARDRGALTVWVRWHEGSVRELPGVHVIDLIGRARITQTL